MLKSAQDTMKKIEIMKDLGKFNPTRETVTLIYMDSSTILVSSSTCTSSSMLLLLISMPRLLQTMFHLLLHEPLQMHNTS